MVSGFPTRVSTEELKEIMELAKGNPDINLYLHLPPQGPPDYKKIMNKVQVLLKDSTPMTEEKLRKIYNIVFLFAGKTQITPPFCSMCLNSGTLANSHVIPNNILSIFPTLFISSLTPNEPKSAAKVTWKLFCTPPCEVDRLSKNGENGFSRSFLGFIEDVKRVRSEGKSVSLTTSDQSVHYCVASVVLRYMIVSGKGDLRSLIDKFGEEVEDSFWRLFFLLRNYVLDKNCSEKPHIQFFLEEKEFKSNTLITTIDCSYDAKDKKWYTTGHFGFNGFYFIVVEEEDFFNKFMKDLTLPPNGFSEAITFNPQTITVTPQHLLTIPNLVKNAIKEDLSVYERALSKVNANASTSQIPSSATGLPQVRVPKHPLVSDPVALYQTLPFVTRLPDEIRFDVTADQTGTLNFSAPDKYKIVDYRREITAQTWIINNIPRKNMFVVVNAISTRKQIVCGFSLDQTFFEKSHLDEVTEVIKRAVSDRDAIKNYLGLTPMHKTDHLGIEHVGECRTIQKYILGILMSYWQSLA